jgi:hypothetical protein
MEARLTPAVSFDVQQSIAPGARWASLAVADFNGDGRPDLARRIQDQKLSIDGTAVSVSLNTSFSAVIGQFGKDVIREYNNDTGA